MATVRNPEVIEALLQRLQRGTQSGLLRWQPTDENESTFDLDRGQAGRAAIWSTDEVDGGYPIFLALYDEMGNERAVVVAALDENASWDNSLWELYRIVVRASSPSLQFLEDFAAEMSEARLGGWSADESPL